MTDHYKDAKDFTRDSSYSHVNGYIDDTKSEIMKMENDIDYLIDLVNGLIEIIDIKDKEIEEYKDLIDSYKGMLP